MVVLQLPSVKRKNETRPKKCPYCSGETFQRWGKVSKPVRDNRYRSVRVYRYRCCHCRRSFRHYPVGMDGAYVQGWGKKQPVLLAVELGSDQLVPIFCTRQPHLLQSRFFISLDST